MYWPTLLYLCPCLHQVLSQVDSPHRFRPIDVLTRPAVPVSLSAPGADEPDKQSASLHLIDVLARPPVPVSLSAPDVEPGRQPDSPPPC